MLKFRKIRVLSFVIVCYWADQGNSRTAKSFDNARSSEKPASTGLTCNTPEGLSYVIRTDFVGVNTTASKKRSVRIMVFSIEAFFHSY
ncbi:hypothetical protein BD410DRAFT_787611 [Rickenella mellea]|uniref:Secreted protein n=1 Tax=Rickenella mellea TaxID=50990 RepID=A0A4Y7Q7U9_9AGAM|nr:hypothetical protein BD410DRAFT_787611 [Rickenella mellea]